MQILVVGKMELAHFSLSYSLDTVRKPVQNAWNIYRRTLKSNQEQET